MQTGVAVLITMIKALYRETIEVKYFKNYQKLEPPRTHMTNQKMQGNNILLQY